ncbi:antiterminator Q family protein, partial [Escherichia coli]|uniref:antiterminator Q family protein n=1 Tax=Escherichia coli TaxID=562 RepID=UPI0024C494BB
KTSIFSHPVYLFLRKFSLQDSRGGSGCMARLKNNNSDLHDLLVDYYVGGMTFMALARKHGRSDCWIGRMLQKAEGVVEGMLMVLDLRLEMDADCLR